MFAATAAEIEQPAANISHRFLRPSHAVETETLNDNLLRIFVYLSLLQAASSISSTTLSYFLWKSRASKHCPSEVYGQRPSALVLFACRRHPMLGHHH